MRRIDPVAYDDRAIILEFVRFFTWPLIDFMLMQLARGLSAQISRQGR